MFWQCKLHMVWFRAVWFDTLYGIEDCLTYLSDKCKEKTSSFSWVNTVIHMTFSCPTTEWLSPWRRVHLEQLTGPQRVKKFYMFIEPGGYCICKSPSLVCIPCRMNALHAFSSWLLKFHFSILQSAFFMEVVLLHLLLIKLHFFSWTQHWLTLIQIVPSLVCSMFQPVLTPSSAISIQKSYKVRYKKLKVPLV
jgi:hypothetical protein